MTMESNGFSNNRRGAKMERIHLNHGAEMPRLGFGVFQITSQEQCRESVLSALETGYRMIDTAACYGNERAVGQAVAASGIARNEVFLVSKVWIQDAGYDRTMASFEKTLENLQTDYLDLYLIHMPYGDYHGSWRAMEELYRAGRVKAIGVCNFQEDRLADLILSHDMVPAVNQMEMHPFCQQKGLRKMMERYGIRTMAWAPFAEGNHNIFRHEVLSDIGTAYGKTPAQVVLCWLIQEGVIAIPKSVHRERIEQNYRINDFRLSEKDMEKIRNLDTGESLILKIRSLDEVYRLHGIRFEQ